MTTKTVETMSMPEYEHKLVFKGVTNAPSSSSVDNKHQFSQQLTQAEVIERHNSQNNAQRATESHIKLSGDKILESDLQRLGTSIDADLKNRVDLDKFQHEENQEYIAELSDEVADLSLKVEEEKENARGWQNKYYEELGRGDSWRTKCMDAERKIEKLKVELEVEASNRKYAEKLMDQTLIAAQQDEELLALLAEKFVNVRKRNLEGN